MKTDTWHGCYPSNWKGTITPEAMTHPAKYSNKLIRKIYEHMREEGWIKPRDTVIDPFGGVALGALDAMRLGLHWRGIELEPRFADLGNENISLWNKKFAKQMLNWGTAELLLGDSRNLCNLLGHGLASAVSSPPYAETLSRDTVPAEKRRALARKSGISNSANVSPIDMEALGMRSQTDYGTTPGQLGAMKAKNFHAAITSPPFGAAQSGGGIAKKGYQNEEKRKGSQDKPFDLVGKRSYMPTNQGFTEGQLANENNNDFWLAARQIVEQVYLALAPGGHAVWVVKDFVKAKKRVPFCDQWRELCESVGFTTLHEHHASLLRYRGTSFDFAGEQVIHQTSSKSFFRRLAENKGSPPIDWEVVFCMEKIR